jgi:hypothetical protein
MSKKLFNEEIYKIKKLMGLIVEQNQPIPNKTIKLPSDYLGKDGTFEKNLHKGLPSDKYYELLKEKKPSEIKKVRLIFPQNLWEEFALKLIKKLGVITGIYKNLGSAIDFIKKLSDKGVKVDELVVGSHGSFGTLLVTQSDDYHFNNNFLNEFKKIIHSNTKVFFTACHGADYLDSLKDASEKLGVGAYASSGVYNYLTNSSEKGYYWCSPKKFDLPTTSEKINPLEFGKQLFIKIMTLEGYKNEKLQVEIKIKDGVFDSPIQPITDITGSPSEEIIDISSNRESMKILTYEIELRWFIFSKLHDNNSYHRKSIELEKQNKYIGDYIKEKFLSNDITVEIIFNGKKINIKSLPLIIKPSSVTNEFLLEKGLCKKINTAPISWLTD